MNPLTTILSAIFGGTGVGSAVANVGKGLTLLTVAPIAWHWYQGHGAEIAVQFSWSQLFFVAGFVYALLQVAHRSNGG